MTEFNHRLSRGTPSGLQPPSGFGFSHLRNSLCLYFPFPLPHCPPQFGGRLTGQMCHKQLKKKKKKLRALHSTAAPRQTDLFAVEEGKKCCWAKLTWGFDNKRLVLVYTLQQDFGLLTVVRLEWRTGQGCSGEGRFTSCQFLQLQKDFHFLIMKTGSLKICWWKIRIIRRLLWHVINHPNLKGKQILETLAHWRTKIKYVEI